MEDESAWRLGRGYGGADHSGMIDLTDILIAPGDPVQPAWEKLIKWAERFQPHAGSRDVRINMMPSGTSVTASFSVPSYAGNFFVRLIGNQVTVGEGTLSEAGGGSFVPYIGSNRADGITADGKTGTPPKFQITGSPPADLQSWIVLQATVEQSTGMLNAKNPQAVQIAHVNDLTPPKNNLIGQQEIAMIRWSDEQTIAEVFQIVRSNLKHQFVATAKGGNVGRHFFYGV
jgi:hypothetical protein